MGSFLNSVLIHLQANKGYGNGYAKDELMKFAAHANQATLSRDYPSSITTVDGLASFSNCQFGVNRLKIFGPRPSKEPRSYSCRFRQRHMTICYNGQYLVDRFFRWNVPFVVTAALSIDVHQSLRSSLIWCVPRPRLLEHAIKPQHCSALEVAPAMVQYIETLGS